MSGLKVHEVPNPDKTSYRYFRVEGEGAPPRVFALDVALLAVADQGKLLANEWKRYRSGYPKTKPA